MKRTRSAALARSGIALVLLIASGWYIARHFEWAEVLGVLGQARYSWFIFSCGALQLIYLIVRTWRWQILIRTANPAVLLRDLYLPNAIAVCLASITPGRVGETVKIEALKRRRILGRAAGLGLLVIERTLDLVVLLGLAVLGLLLAPTAGLIDSHYPLMALLVILFIIALVVLLSARASGSLKTVLDRTGLTGMRAGPVAAAVGGTLVCWLVVALSWQIALAATGVWLALPQTLTLLALTTFGGLISFVPGALGVAEVITSELLQLYGVDPIRAQAGAIMLRLYGLMILVIGLFHLLYWWTKNLRVSSAR